MKSGVQPWMGCGSKAGWLTEGEPSAAFEPAENPFVRPDRARRPRAAREEAREQGAREQGVRAQGVRDQGDETDQMTGDGGEIDASALPPSFSAGIPAIADAEPEEAPATRKLPPRRRRKPEGDAGEGDNLTAVG